MTVRNCLDYFTFNLAFHMFILKLWNVMVYCSYFHSNISIFVLPLKHKIPLEIELMGKCSMGKNSRIPGGIILLEMRLYIKKKRQGNERSSSIPDQKKIVIV